MGSPQPPMNGRFMPTLDNDPREVGRSLYGPPAKEERCRDRELVQLVDNAPDTGPHPIGEYLFLPKISRSGVDDADHLANGLTYGVTVTNLALGAFTAVFSIVVVL
ncbi:hypothetical protein QO002_005610 [Pararhizobium capsulatum DSM 1112]|uniref:Uncharacterized protein n=1 Tax=Pararhizobium capsulatum DSM 1112 TaxID=1121113 RepID=A0ABU0BYS5_9HYPH|nr:hypothetical protein [Pararhizobium capsulatum]MDQ0323404.1 hypothetical protein [Pararhizobium capsulatum DSM 1112]